MAGGPKDEDELDLVQVEIVEPGQPGGGHSSPPSGRRPSGPTRGRARAGWALALLAVAVLVVVGAGVVRHAGQVPGTPTMAVPNGTAGLNRMAAPVTASDVNVLAKLGEQVSVYGYTGFGPYYPPTVMRLDLATGVEVDTQIPEVDSDGPVSVVSDARGVIVRPWNAGAGYRVSDGDPASGLRGLLASGSGPALPGPTLGTFWVADQETDTATATATNRGPTEMVLVDADGRAVGPRVSLGRGADAVASDGAGGIIQVGPGQEIFQMSADQQGKSVGANGPTATGSPQTATGIGNGRLIAASAGGYVYLPCGGPDCGLTYVDRATHQQLTMAIAPEMGTILGGTLSPDGTHLAALMQPPVGGQSTSGSVSAQSTGAPPAVDQDNPPVLAMFDLATSESRLTPAVPPNPVAGTGGLAWTPDSQWLLVATDHHQLIAVSADTQTTLNSRVEVPYLAHLAITPTN